MQDTCLACFRDKKAKVKSLSFKPLIAVSPTIHGLYFHSFLSSSFYTQNPTPLNPFTPTPSLAVQLLGHDELFSDDNRAQLLRDLKADILLKKYLDPFHSSASKLTATGAHYCLCCLCCLCGARFFAGVPCACGGGGGGGADMCFMCTAFARTRTLAVKRDMMHTIGLIISLSPALAQSAVATSVLNVYLSELRQQVCGHTPAKALFCVGVVLVWCCVGVVLSWCGVELS